jgi:hypothetical protein
MTWARRIAVLAILAVLLATPFGLAGAQSLPWREAQEPVRDTANIVVGEHELEVELSITGPQQTLGLGYRDGLDEGTGMLFVNQNPAGRTFWMKGMRFCIDIVWIEAQEITGAAESVCPDPAGTLDADRARYSSGQPVTYVLELPAGWLDQHGYGPGTPVEIPDSIPALVDDWD